MTRKLNLFVPRTEVDGTTRTYWTRDKSDWGTGPWKSEPDKIQWIDEATGLPCLMVRNNLGFLCGYVGVTPDHPWYGVDYDYVGNGPKPDGYDPDWYPDVHGGVTYAAKCMDGDEAETICHVPESGAEDDVWWLGFDCGHLGDFTAIPTDPKIAAIYAESERRFPGVRDNDVYRDVDFVRNECASLALQAAAQAKVLERNTQ